MTPQKSKLYCMHNATVEFQSKYIEIATKWMEIIMGDVAIEVKPEVLILYQYALQKTVKYCRYSINIT
jgi:valyl-tRNA synthetase